MAYELTSTNGQVQYGIDVYTIDFKEDLKKLPKRSKMGSQALCLEDGNVYIKKSDGTWKEI